MIQLPVIREEQKPAAVFVQTADWNKLSRVCISRKQIKRCRSVFVLGGTQNTFRFVQQEVKMTAGNESFSVYLEPGRFLIADMLFRVLQLNAVQTDTPLPEHQAHVFAGACSALC